MEYGHPRAWYRGNSNKRHTTMKNSKEKSPAERGETFTVPTYGIANTDPLNMTKRAFEAWMAVQSEGPAKDAIRAARDKKEAWARRELEKLAQPVRRDYFGANGPTGHGEECHSDADPGL